MTSGLRISDIGRSTGIGIQTTTKTMENKTIDNLIVCSLNCQGIKHSKDFIINFLTDNACDILCLQETLTIDSNINILGNIHNDFLFTGVSGIDHTIDISQGRPKGGVALLYRKFLSSYITPIKISVILIWLILLILSLLIILIILRMFYIHAILITL